MNIKHLTSINDLSREQIEEIFERADKLSSFYVDSNKPSSDSVFIANLFFEPSTRTRLSFETAAKRLGLQVLTMNENTSSRVKGETYLDTVLTLEAMGAKAFVIRSKDEDICNQLVETLSAIKPHIHIINAGGGQKDHPTQGLLDVYTMQQHFDSLTDKKICIIGDIKHSRVARSTVQVLKKLRINNIHLIAPKNLLPDSDEFKDCFFSEDLKTGLTDADIVMALRIQKERMQSSDIPNTEVYSEQFGIKSERLSLAKDHAIVMHPGPMNRGVEISSELADSQRSVITEQVANGVLIRMAMLDLMLN